MPIASQLRVLLARVNLERATRGQPALSLRRLAEESGVSLSVVAALNTGQSQRIDYATIDRLLDYFNRYFIVTTNDLLAWEPAYAGNVADGAHQRAGKKRSRSSRVRRSLADQPQANMRGRTHGD